MSWREITLGGAIRIKHGFAFKSHYFCERGKHIVLTPGNFYEEGGFRLRAGKDRAYDGNIPEGYILDEGDLIVAMTEQGPGLLGSSALIPESDRFLHNQRLGLINIIDSTILSKRFLYYLFNTKTVRGQINGSASGTKVRHTAPDRIYRVHVKIPQVREQEKIVDILSAYDTLIENNRRRIALLEQSARLLYNEWFVHLRFPGHEHVKITDGVPDGWERKQIGDIIDFLGRGITPKYDDEAPCIVINQKCIRNQLINLELARNQSKKVPENKLVHFGDVLVNSTGEGTLGRVAQFFEDVENCTVDSHITIVRPDERIPKFFFGMYLSSLEKYLSIMGRGATNQTELSKASIAEIPISLPPMPLAKDFEENAAVLFSHVKNLLLQNNKLTEARDLLLPRLMNGEIAV